MALARLDGKRCLITGATSGIGEETALGLARLGAELILVARSEARAQATRERIRNEAGSEAVEVMSADLASFASIRDFAREFRARHDSLDLLVNNAGMVGIKYAETVDGIEQVFAVNHLAPFLLTNLLLEPLKSAAPARVVNVASTMHRFAKMNFDDPGLKSGYSGWTSYNQSKLANILFTKELARRLEGTGVTVNAVHPGGVATRLGHNNGRGAVVFTKIAAPFLRTPAQGAKTSIHVAASPDLDGVTGEYFANERRARASRAANDAAAAERLWELSARMTGLAS
ncbi:MAG: SDR family oxidoreductase [Myxococcales bacterium]|nr:SDR family oxidoreductase [Myxococcales bacterium]